MDGVFQEKGFKVVRNFYDVNNHRERNPELYQFLLNSKHLAVNNVQSPGAEAFYNNIELCKMQIKSLPKMEEETGLK